jgi:DNA topoisomerase IB
VSARVHARQNGSFGLATLRRTHVRVRGDTIAIDRAGADLAIHGHAHRGSEHGVTPGGINVRNVGRSVIHQAYAVYTFSGDHEQVPATATTGIAGL